MFSVVWFRFHYSPYCMQTVLLPCRISPNLHVHHVMINSINKPTISCPAYLRCCTYKASLQAWSSFHVINLKCLRALVGAAIPIPIPFRRSYSSFVLGWKEWSSAFRSLHTTRNYSVWSWRSLSECSMAFLSPSSFFCMFSHSLTASSEFPASLLFRV